ncbi:MAG: Eco57I restriction-modification methylase domain-containing protein [Anaerolineaceae bacterium]
MSIARHHNEWLSLIEISGPFLSLPVLMRTFPQGLEALDRDGLAELRLAYEEWLDDQNSLRPSPAIHSVWVRYVLEHVLGFGKSHLLEGPAIPATLQAFVAEQGETLRPDLAIVSNDPSAQKPRMLVQVCPITQGLEKSMQNHRWKASPAMRMLELLRATGVSLGLVTNGEQWMLVNAPKGETSAFVSWYAALWLEESLTLRAFSSLLGATRFFSVADEDTLEGMLKDSVNEQQEVTDQLGYQVRRAVEVLIRAIDKADQDCGRTLLKYIPEKDLYEAALTVMMRLVFLFSAEERGLLLLGDPLYDQNYAVSTLRAQLRETADQQGEEVLERRFDAWCRLLATFRAVHDGIHHDRLNLPAYGGSLFDPERYPFLEGRSTQTSRENAVLPISNRTVLHLLEALQVLRVKLPGGGLAEARRISFRALDVEQIGHVYEGLLDHIAVRAGDPVLGLAGTREKEPELSLPILRAEEVKGEKSFLAFLKEQTGRSENALRKALLERPDVFTNQHLLIACNNDAKMLERVAPYAGLLREDDFGYPAVFLPGSVYVTAGATRRATGTHYTPRSLTEPIVQHTLEPLVYTGPAEGLPKEEWKLKSPAELLELKVCDMAMGSAGFLVQVIRYLSERLVEAWDILNPEGSNPDLRITPEGQPASGKPGELIIPADDEERLVLARRLVADRCIYGVDKNPLAVEIAKLSIWLTTMDKGRPFTFLDHALKCGDSLVGADEDMYRKWAYSLKGAQFTLYLTTLEEFTAAARQKRKELESFTVLDVRDAEHKAELLKEADAAMARVKLGCDLLVGARLLGLKLAEQETLLSHLLWDYIAGLPMDTPDAQRALHAARKERAFHWPFEFPEVFKKGGFNAFVGNPPFLGGKKISSMYGDYYYTYLKMLWPHAGGSSDLCAFFYLQAYFHLQIGGYFGLLATNTISQGDTREFGLDHIISNDGVIYRAIPSLQWPGTAAVFVSVVYLKRGRWEGALILNDKKVPSITSFLDDSLLITPFKLFANSAVCGQGAIIFGDGFTLSYDMAKDIISKNPKNKEIIFPYLSGEDLNQRPDQSPSRMVINFHDWPIEKVKGYSECFDRIESLVFPQRKKVKRKAYREKWWQYAERQANLLERTSKLEKVLVKAKTSKTWAFGFIEPDIIYSTAVIGFVFEDFLHYAVLQSSIHQIWAEKYASTLKSDMAYTPTDCFENFPFPELKDILIENGEEYYLFRREVMLANQEGLTSTYNRFNNPKEKSTDIVHLRELHVEMDNAVAAAYGWSNLDLGHGFHETPQGVRFTISEAARREVLSRLLQLNHERYEEEVRQGLHEKDKKKAKEEQPARQKSKKLAQPEGQMNLLAEPEAQDAAGAGEPVLSTPAAEIGSWDCCKCLACGKTVMGFSIAEHTQSEHQGKDPGYRKMGG